MHIYRVLDSDTDTVLSFRDTLKSAHRRAKQESENDRDDVRIELINIPTDKIGILNLLACLVAQEMPEAEALRTWKLTARGGLKEIPNGE